MFRYLDVAGTTGVNESRVDNPATWSLAHMWDQGFKNTGSAITFTPDATLNVDWGIIKKLRFGLRIDQRKASEESRFAEGDPITGTDLASFNTRFPGIVSVNSGFFDGRADIPSSWASINGDYSGSNSDAIRKLYTFTNTSYWQLKESFNIEELTSAAYLQVDRMETEIAGRKLTGQLGLRLVDIKTEMEFTNPGFTHFTKTTGDAGVTKLLPSATFSYDITRRFVARVGYGETIRRPAFNALNPLITYTRDVTNLGLGTARGGNPALKPTTSKNYDVALEYYFDQSSMVHANYFRKKIDGLVIDSYRRVSYTDSIGPYNYILQQPTNASDGKLEGVEIGGKYYPQSLPGFLSGAGLEASYTHLKTEQNVPLYDSTTGRVIGSQNTPFYAVSPNSFSVTLAYERSKFSARVSYAWRSAFHHHNEAAQFANPLYVYNSAERSFNAQLSYKLSKNLSIDLEGTNLTDDVQHSYYGKNGATVHNFGNWIVGRTFSAGVRYSF